MDNPHDFASHPCENSSQAPEAQAPTSHGGPQSRPSAARAAQANDAPYAVGWEDEADDQRRATEADELGLPPPPVPSKTFASSAVWRRQDGKSPALDQLSQAEPTNEKGGQGGPSTNGRNADRAKLQIFERAEQAIMGSGPTRSAQDASANGVSERPAPEKEIECASPVKQRASSSSLTLPHASKLGIYPAIFSRSALFRAGGADDGAQAASAPIAIDAQDGVDMILTGPWPRMRDKEVWEVAMDMAKASRDASAAIPVVLSQFANRMGYAGGGGNNLRWIWDSLRRLAQCHVEFNPPWSPGARIAGKLLLAATEVGGQKEIQIDAPFASRLLAEDYQFAMSHSRRSTLTSSLARWLHDFLSTHGTSAKPFTLPYLRGLCGYRGDKRRFPADLRQALDELAAKAPGILASSAIDTSTRSSEGWTVALVCGDEKRRFEKPNVGLKSAHGLKASGRGKVAL